MAQEGGREVKVILQEPQKPQAVLDEVALEGGGPAFLEKLMMRACA